jgi:predicted nucleic acid-binding protein
VRDRARQSPGLACCELGKLEFSNILRRHEAERRLTRAARTAAWREFGEDEHDGVWLWLPIDSALLQRVIEELEKLPPSVPLRSADAIHLTCAKSHGFDAIYSNDRHLLAAAPHFGLHGVNLTCPA